MTNENQDNNFLDLLQKKDIFKAQEVIKSSLAEKSRDLINRWSTVMFMDE
jgi:hypothetical protein